MSSASGVGRRPERQVRASYDSESITVYQAYEKSIADAAVRAGRFVPPFKRDRMTWIKPSFCWMMYRSGWGAKPNQERILKIDLAQSGFEWALAHSCLSSFDPAVHGSYDAWSESKTMSPVRVQWDPERSVQLAALPWRAIQIGISGPAVDMFVDEWILGIEDLTPSVHEMRVLLAANETETVEQMLPVEGPYPISSELARRIGSSIEATPGS